MQMDVSVKNPFRVAAGRAPPPARPAVAVSFPGRPQPASDAGSVGPDSWLPNSRRKSASRRAITRPITPMSAPPPLRDWVPTFPETRNHEHPDTERVPPGLSAGARQPIPEPHHRPAQQPDQIASHLAPAQPDWVPTLPGNRNNEHPDTRLYVAR